MIFRFVRPEMRHFVTSSVRRETANCLTTSITNGSTSLPASVSFAILLVILEDGRKNRQFLLFILPRLKPRTTSKQFLRKLEYSLCICEKMFLALQRSTNLGHYLY